MYRSFADIHADDDGVHQTSSLDHRAGVGDRGAVARAAQQAGDWHAGQFDKADMPYIGHCRRVAAKLDSPTAQVVALLHDVVEDAPPENRESRRRIVRADFGDEVADAVDALTRSDEVPSERYYAVIRESELARQVKLADMHDNLDPRRLAKLDAPTAHRLAAKYGAALVALFGEGR
jgi:(p)ppGpp synthase/HD superfamily hydrolase